MRRAARLAGRRPPRDATLVARLQAAGAFVIGKAVTSQYALFVRRADAQSARSRAHAGRLVERFGGGGRRRLRAGGAGTQTNGSIIRPASYCGVVGFKPSLGVLPRTGVLRHCALVDHPGVFARDVEDAALLVDALAGADDEDPTVRDLDGSLLAAARDEPPPRLALLADPYADRAEPATRAALERFAAGLPNRRARSSSSRSSPRRRRSCAT